MPTRDRAYIENGILKVSSNDEQQDTATIVNGILTVSLEDIPERDLATIDEDGILIVISAGEGVPTTFGADDWSVADRATDGDITITIIIAAEDLTDIEYDVDGDENWTTIGGATVGEYVLSGFTNDQEYDIRIRGVIEDAEGTASASKAVTPTVPGAAPVIGDQAADFGALTLSGAGGWKPAVTGGVDTWAITAGNASGHWAIDASTGFITPTSTGDTANLNAGPYALTVEAENSEGSDTATVTLTALANTYSALTNAEVSAILAIAVGTLAGKTIKLRPGDYTRISITSKAYGSTVTLTSEEGANIAGVTVQNSTNVTVTGNSILVPHPAGSALTVVAIIGVSADNIVISDNDIGCDTPVDVNADWSAGYNAGAFSGIATASSGGLPGDITITGNTIHDVTIGVNVAPVGDLVVTNNEIYRCYSDGIKVSSGPLSTTINWNDIYHLFGAAADTGNPHPDGIQFQGGAAADWTDIEIIGNRVWRGNARGGIQGIFLDDQDSGFFYTAHIANNFVDCGAVNSIKINRAKDCIVQNNTVVGPPVQPYGGSARSSVAGIYIGADENSGTNIILDNITEAISFYGTYDEDNNVVLGLEVAAPYTDYTATFDGPTFNPDTVSEVMTLFNMKTAGSADGTYNAGAIGTGYSDFDAMTYTAPRSSSSGDATAPELTSPNASATGTTTADLAVTTDEDNGTLYAVVTTSATPPSAAQVKAGQDHASASATFADDQVIVSTGAKLFSATGLSAGTTYYAYFMHEDAATNQSDVAAASSFATDAATPSAGFTDHDGLTNNLATGNSYTHSSIAIGTAHEDRVVTVFALSTQILDTPTIGGNAMTAVDAPANANTPRSYRYATGGTSLDAATTANIVIANNSGSTAARSEVLVFVSYPSSATPVDNVRDTQASTTDAVGANLDVVNGGCVVAAGTGPSGNLTFTWNGTDTPSEVHDALTEAAPQYGGAFIAITETNSTRDITLAAASGSKTISAISYGAPA